MRLLFLVLSLFAVTSAGAHQDVVYSINKGTFHLQYKSGWRQLEIGTKLDIFTVLTDRLIRQNFPKAEPFYFYFNHDYTKSDTSYVALGYGDFSDWDYNSAKPSVDIKTRGIKLIIRERDFDIKKLINLIYSAYSNLEQIKGNQSTYVIPTKYSKGDTVQSIPFSIVRTYSEGERQVIHEIMKEKVYRTKEKLDNGAINYFFQNNRFHFFDTRPPNEEWDPTANKFVVTKIYGQETLTVDNIFEIVGKPEDGHFVFVNDSAFYFISPAQKVSGPFTIDSVVAGRPPIRKFYHEHRPLNKFTLFIDNYSSYDKALFFPDSNLVVSNFEKIENEMINEFFQKTPPKTAADGKAGTTGTLLLLGLLGVSVMANFWLLKRRTANGS